MRLRAVAGWMVVGSAVAFAIPCESLTSLALPYSTMLSAKPVGAGEFSLPTPGRGPNPNAAFKNLPAFCRGGDGTDEFDAVKALEQWVEKSNTLERIEASRVRNGKVDRTRPLCAYPKVARWDGHDDPTQAASFRCTNPD